mgnify:FL=1
MRVILITIIVLSLAGIFDAGYALSQHYAPADTSSCDFNETVSCTAVNQSQYSEIAGIPVAGIGMTGYLLLSLLAAAGLSRFAWGKLAPRLLLATSLSALGVSIWLTYVEIVILKAICPLCVLSLVLITMITILAILVEMSRRRG